METEREKAQPPSSQQASLTDKEWLDLAWKYFQQHAQQRVAYFNFFVIFSTILTTGYVGTFQKTYGMPAIGIAIGFIQLFIAFIFIKIDERNSWLAKHAENAIKKIEEVNCSTINFQLFTLEETNNVNNRAQKKKMFMFFQPFTHGKSFRLIYYFFMLLGLTGIILSCILLQTKKNEQETMPFVYNIILNSYMDDSTLQQYNTKKSLQLIDSILKPHLKK